MYPSYCVKTCDMLSIYATIVCWINVWHIWMVMWYMCGPIWFLVHSLVSCMRWWRWELLLWSTQWLYKQRYWTDFYLIDPIIYMWIHINQQSIPILLPMHKYSMHVCPKNINICKRKTSLRHVALNLGNLYTSKTSVRSTCNVQYILHVTTAYN